MIIFDFSLNATVCFFNWQLFLNKPISIFIISLLIIYDITTQKLVGLLVRTVFSTVQDMLNFCLPRWTCGLLKKW